MEGRESASEGTGARPTDAVATLIDPMNARHDPQEPHGEDSVGVSVGGAHEAPAHIAPEKRVKRKRTMSADVVGAGIVSIPGTTVGVCSGCGGSEATEINALLQCQSCNVLVHWMCYRDEGKPTGLCEEERASWQCDVCLHTRGTSNRSVKCVYCVQRGGSPMRLMDMAQHSVPQLRNEGEPQFGHLLCVQWDPFAEDVAVRDTSDAIPEQQQERLPPSSDPFERLRPKLPVPPCCFCSSDEGIRIQCRLVNCGRFFHAMCASQSARGHLDIVKAPYPHRHAYCDRHHECRGDVGGIVKKLLSKPVVSLLPRDAGSKLQAIYRRVDSYQSVDELLDSVTALLVDVCKKGLKSSKSDPPSFSVKHLQVLQLVQNHLPQLHKVYDRSTFSKSSREFVDDPDLRHALQKAFNPSRFVRKFAGPLSQLQLCQVCLEPFQERQHVFYCTGADMQHCQHWKCTKRRSNAKERGGSSANAKKKLKSVALVQHGVWSDVKVPKALPSVSDGIACGLCRSPVDARAIVAGRKEATRIDFEKQPSAFMFGGAFANKTDARSGAGGVSVRSFRPSSSATHATQKSQAKNPRRGAAASERDTKVDVDAPVLLAPQKMERINVRRTTRWLACIGQVIKLMLASRREQALAAEHVDDTTITENGSAADTTAASVATSAAARLSDKTPIESEPSAQVASEDGTEAPSTNASNEEAQTMESMESRPNSDEQAQSIESLEREECGASVETPDSLEPAEATVAKMTDTQVIVADRVGSIALADDVADAAPEQEQVETQQQAPTSRLPARALAYLEEAKKVVRPFDPYALDKMETAHEMLEQQRGPGLSILNTLVQEYTRFVYIKHTRAVEKATNEKRKRQEQEAQEERERERKRIDREAEMALKKQMLAMRKKQRQQVKEKSAAASEAAP